MNARFELSVPTNWDDALIEGYRGLPVVDVYGSTGRDPVGGGRPGFLLDRVSSRHASAHVRRLRDAGFSFTYLLNAPCLGNLEYQTAFRRELDEHVRWIRDAGATGVTVSIPLLVDVVKRVAPQLEVKLSVIAHVDSVQRARLMESLGADEITLDYNINRELALLAAIRGAVSVRLSLDVNDLCLYRCPLRYYCYNTTGHASQAGHESGGFIVDYCFFRCHRIKLADPVEIVRSPWIRPEDLPMYAARTGIRRFKVAGRTKETPQILRAVEAYARMRFDGNLLEILETPTRDTSTPDFRAARWVLSRLPRIAGAGIRALALGQRSIPRAYRRTFVANLARVPASATHQLLDAYLEMANLGKVAWLDGRLLDGFLAEIQQRDCRSDCASCTVCERWAARAVRVEPDGAARAIAALDRVIEGIVDGTYTTRFGSRS